MNYLQVIEILQKIEDNTRYVSMKTNLNKIISNK